MNEMLIKLANELASNGKVLRLKDNSFLRAYPDLNNDNTINVISDKLSTMVNGEIDIVKNRVLPFIKEYKEKVEDILPKNNYTPADEIDIKEFFVPDNIKLMINLGLINTEREPEDYRVPISSLTISIDSVANIKKLLKTGRSEIDEYADELIQEFTDPELEDLWHSIFDRVSGSNPIINEISLWTTGRARDIFALYLITYNLLKDNSLVSYNSSEGEFVRQINALQNIVLNKLVYFINLTISYQNTKTIIIGLGENEIRVYRDTYMEYMQNGGDIEIILGAYIRQLAHATIDKLNEMKEELLEAWKQHSNMFNVNKKLKDINGFKLAYKIALIDILAEYRDVESIISIINPDIYERTDEKVMAYLNDLTLDKLYEVKETSEDICLDLVFNYTNAKEFIEQMREYSKMDENIDPKQAATLSALNLIVTFLINQFNIEGNGN